MGCAHSRVEEEETVWRCRERLRLMKQLLICRSELAAAHMAYLQSLRNTGATLRQFAEAESDFPGIFHSHVASPPSMLPPPPPPPPPPLPPSPPTPHFSTRKEVMELGGRSNIGDDYSANCIGADDDDCIPPPLPIHSSTWNFWDPLGIPSCSRDDNDEECREGKREFEGCSLEKSLISLKKMAYPKDLNGDNISMINPITKETEAVVDKRRSKKTLLAIVKDIDDYFLKAAAGGSDLLILLESTHGLCLENNFNKTKGRTLKSAKVLSWSWSLKSYHSNRGGCGQNCQSSIPGKHRITLEKIYNEEVKLYKEVKEDELAKVQLKKMASLLEKLETIENDYTRSEKLRSDIETLQTKILSLQNSINATCLSISKSRDEELHPQLMELLLGLSCMWRTMYECHQVQNRISQQGNLLDNHPGTEPTTDSHHFATLQLENEVASWHSSFGSLLNSLREYSHVLNQWVRLTDCLPYTNNISVSIKKIHCICEEWQLALDRLPDKAVADSIKSLVSVIHSIVLQQNVELSLQKKSKKLETRLEKKLNSTSPAKLDALKKRVEEEKGKYVASICLSRGMALNNLYASLPDIFQALVGFSNVCLQVLDDIVRPAEAPTGC